MNAAQRASIAVLCLVLAGPAAAQPHQLAPLGFALDGVEATELPRASRAQWRAVLSAMFPPPPGTDHRLLQRAMLEDGHDRRRDVRGAFDPHGLSEPPPAGHWPDLEWHRPDEGNQHLFIVPVSATLPIEAIERTTAAGLKSPCGPIPMVRLGRLLPTRPGIATFGAECRGQAPDGTGMAHSGAVAGIAPIADGLALIYEVFGPRAGARHIDRFQALVTTMRPDAVGARQALRAEPHALARRLGAALNARSSMVFTPIESERWERAGPMNVRLCDAKWGDMPGAVICLRVFPAGESAEALLARLLLVDTWECGARVVQRSPGAEHAGATVRCEDGAKVGGIATRLYTVRRSPVDGTLAFAAVYGSGEADHLLAIARMADTVLAEVLARR